jgi:hypothetical protein
MGDTTSTPAEITGTPVVIPEEGEIEFPIEAETEMESAVGNSRMKITMTGIKINEPVEFKWMEIRRAGGGKK